MDLRTQYLRTISSEQTRRAYRTDLQRLFGEGALDASKVRAVDPDAIQSFVRTMSRSGLSLSTQRRRLAAIRGFYDWLVQDGVVSRNPARHPDVEPMRSEAESSSCNLLSAADVESMIAIAAQSGRSGIRDQAIVLTIVYGALRRHEVSTLEVEDVRPLGRHWILDLDDASSPNNSYVRIPETLVETIERVKGRYGITEGPLWRSVSNQNQGAPMTPDAIYKVVRGVSEQAGLDPIGIDTLRRTGLQLALKEGAGVPQVQAHGRLADPASAARLHDSDVRSGALENEVTEYIDLDIEEALKG